MWGVDVLSGEGEMLGQGGGGARGWRKGWEAMFSGVLCKANGCREFGGCMRLRECRMI